MEDTCSALHLQTNDPLSFGEKTNRKNAETTLTCTEFAVKMDKTILCDKERHGKGYGKISTKV